MQHFKHSNGHKPIKTFVLEIKYPYFSVQLIWDIILCTNRNDQTWSKLGEGGLEEGKERYLTKS
jgi:hypothetical protein